MMNLYMTGLVLISALVHVTTADVIALAVGSDVIIKDSSDNTRTPCGKPTSYIPTGATFDPTNSVLYWVGRRQSWVGVAQMNMGVASLRRKIYTDIISDGYDIEFDSTSGLLYVAAKEGIVVMDTNGTESVQIVQNGEPQSVALDPIGRHLYWSDKQARVIWRANLDGRKRHAVYFEAEKTTSVAVDVSGRRLFWAEENVIFSSTLNGTDVKSVKTPTKEVIVQLAVRGESVYYATNWRAFRVNKQHILKGHLEENSTEVIARANCMELRTLAVHSPEPIKSDTSSCAHKNGGCYKLCIPVQGGITCASKREIMHNKMEAPLPPPGTRFEDGEVKRSEIDILYEKEEAELRVVYPVIVSVVVLLTVALIVVIVCYWKKARKDHRKKLIWDIQEFGDIKPGMPGLRSPISLQNGLREPNPDHQRCGGNCGSNSPHCRICYSRMDRKF